MTRQMTPALKVEDPRGHSTEEVKELRQLLETGAVAHSDPRHDYVYELEGERRVFYLYLYPGGEKVQLLATWPSDGATGLMEQTAQ
jgi:hypothetical protein